MQQKLQNSKNLVSGVFDKVYDKYDLMNNLMSLGIHKSWKKQLIYSMNPKKNKKIIDVACGTGDIAKLFIEATNSNSKVHCVDPNRKMISIGKQKLKNYNNISWKIASAEKLPFKDSQFDYYVISFGLRNTKNLNKTLSEAYRVLKKGGRFFCLEFSKIDNDYLNFIYQNYSKLIPVIGEFIIGDKKPYEYLIQSIKEFIDQKELINLMKRNNFEKCDYINLNGGIVALHSAWKI
mgnify:FL=1|tara:strand:+ start:647 stop:1351 length:705 start_codon:yes stop_codon:yes gene_type:complete